MTSRGEIFMGHVNKSSSLKSRRDSVEYLSQYDTPDARRLGKKLKDPDIASLMTRAESLVSGDLKKVSIKNVYFDLGTTWGIIEREEVWSWKRALKDVLDEFTFERLDWLWDMAWSFNLWPVNRFKRLHFSVYMNIRGNKPQGLDQPYQLVLSAERRERIRTWERGIFIASKKGDLNKLNELGLDEELGKRTIAYTLQHRQS